MTQADIWRVALDVLATTMLLVGAITEWRDERNDYLTGRQGLKGYVFGRISVVLCSGMVSLAVWL